MPAETIAGTNILGQDHAWCLEGTARRPTCLELSKQGEKELRAGRGRGRWGLWALGEDWASTHKEVRAVEDCGQRRGGA